MGDVSELLRKNRVLVAFLSGLAGYALLRRVVRADEPETVAVAGSRKPGRAARPDSEDPLERIESQVLARESDR